MNSGKEHRRNFNRCYCLAGSERSSMTAVSIQTLLSRRHGRLLSSRLLPFSTSALHPNSLHNDQPVSPPTSGATSNDNIYENPRPRLSFTNKQYTRGPLATQLLSNPRTRGIERSPILLSDDVAQVGPTRPYGPISSCMNRQSRCLPAGHMSWVLIRGRRRRRLKSARCGKVASGHSVCQMVLRHKLDSRSRGCHAEVYPLTTRTPSL